MFWLDKKPEKIIGIEKDGDSFILANLINHQRSCEVSLAKVASLSSSLDKEATSIVGLDANTLLLRSLIIPSKKTRIVRKLIPFQTEQLFPLAPKDQMVLPISIKQTEGTLIHAFSVSKTIIKTTLTKWQKIGLNPHVIGCNTVALLRFASFFEKEATNFFLIHIKKQEGQVLLIKNGELKNTCTFEAKYPWQEDSHTLMQKIKRAVTELADIKEINENIDPFIICGTESLFGIKLLNENPCFRARLPSTFMTTNPANGLLPPYIYPVATGLALDQRANDLWTIQLRQKTFRFVEPFWDYIKKKKQLLLYGTIYSMCAILSIQLFYTHEMKKLGHKLIAYQPSIIINQQKINHKKSLDLFITEINSRISHEKEKTSIAESAKRAISGLQAITAFCQTEKIHIDTINYTLSPDGPIDPDFPNHYADLTLSFCKADAATKEKLDQWLKIESWYKDNPQAPQWHEQKIRIFL